MDYCTNTSITLSSNIQKLFALVLICITMGNNGYSQCLTAGDIGDFELANLSDQWWNGTQGNGVFSIDATDSFTGSKSTKVEVNVESPWQVRMYNLNCGFNIVSAGTYKVTIYVKGTIGTSLDITLLDNTVTQSTQKIILSSSEWKKYQVILTSSSTSSNGKIRLSFRDIGVYHVDNLYYEQITMSTIANTDANICWEGVLESEVITGGQLRTFRFLKSYATNNVPNYHSADRASSSAGIIMKLKTNSPSVNLSFTEDLTWSGDVFYHKISVFKDDVFQFNTNDFDFALSNTEGSAVEWKLIMPTYTQVNLKSIALESGYTIENNACNDQPVYVAIGNSITMGVGLTENDSRDAYSRVVADSLGYELYNWGIGGSKVHDTVYSNFQNSSLKPDLITVLWGYNDVHYSTNDDHFSNSTFPKYESLLTSVLQNYPNACVMAILPTFTNNPTNTTTRTLSNLESGQLSIINSLQLTYPNLDYMLGSNYTTALSLADDVHLNNVGNQSLAYGIINEVNCSVITSKVDHDLENSIKMYPNPTSGLIYLNKAQEYLLLSLSGETLLNSFGQKVDLSQFKKGIYLLKVKAKFYKIVKN